MLVLAGLMTAWLGAGSALAVTETGDQETREVRTIKAIVVASAREFGVDPALALAVAEKESSFRPDAVSRNGAVGVMQVMPRTAKGEFGVDGKALRDPRRNVEVGVKLLKRLLDRYDGDAGLALAHYNAGAGSGAKGRKRMQVVAKPYVRQVLDLREKYRRAG